MSNTTKVIIFVFVVIVSIPIIALFNVIDDARSLYLYNPFDEIMEVVVDERKYSLAKREKFKIHLKEGLHRVKSYTNDKNIMDTVIEVYPSLLKTRGILNLSGEPMYLVTTTYATSVYNAISAEVNPIQQKMLKNATVVVVDSFILFGNIKEYKNTELIIEKEWYYDIDQDFEKHIEMKKDVYLSEDISKIFDKKGILSYWKTTYGDSILIKKVE